LLLRELEAKLDNMDPTIIIFELAAAIFSIGCMFGYGTRSAISQYRRRYRRRW